MSIAKEVLQEELKATLSEMMEYKYKSVSAKTKYKTEYYEKKLKTVRAKATRLIDVMEEFAAKRDEVVKELDDKSED
jgi:hypothetical protein